MDIIYLYIPKISDGNKFAKATDVKKADPEATTWPIPSQKPPFARYIMSVLV
jgi:hypothetical protein